MPATRRDVRPDVLIVLAFLLIAAMGGRGSADELQADELQAEKKGASTTEQRRERGEAVYKRQCAACHGNRGEGVEDEYAEPLVGDATVGELSKLIAETMPEETPEACVGSDAGAVAAFVHYRFYSEAARIRNRPPRRMLSHLTGSQLRQSLADLYARSEGIASPVERRGLEATYYDGARWKKGRKEIKRIDPTLDFDFGRKSPADGISAKSFQITWKGGVKADVTGRYEIVVRSTCSFVCDFGKIGRRLIDNHVQSGDQTEFRRSVTLTAGRVYPIQINFVQRQRKTEQPPASISLSWVPPGGTEQILPAQNLVPGWAPATFSLQTKLPPDDRSYGYDRGIAVNRQWDDSTTTAALEFAQIASQELWPAYRRKHKNDSDENRGRLRSFLRGVIETAFRRPLNDELRRLYVDRQVDQTEDDAEAIKRSLLVSLKSPRFLYPTVDQDQSPSQRAANRLTLVLFDSLPSDRWIVDQVRNGKLAGDDPIGSEKSIRAAARRMVADYRTRGKTRQFLYEWLNLSHLGEISKDKEAFPEFDAALVSDLRGSFDAFLDEVVWSETSDYRQLFQADWSYTTDRLANFYGDSWKPADAEGPRLRRSVSDPRRRQGLLTHPYLMSGLAYQDSTSPIHRGVFLIRHVLGRTLRPPSEAFTPLNPDLHPDLTTRQRVALQTGSEGCQVCHRRINGLGFTLENYDAVGRYRLKERDKPIITKGSYTSRAGEQVAFEGANALAEYLATSVEAQRAFVDRAFQHFVKQPVAAYGPDTLDRLTKGFANSGYSVRELLVEIAVTAALNDTYVTEQES